VDHLDTPRLVADAAGTTVWKWDQQEPFGDSSADGNPFGIGAFEFPLRFPGQYPDKETNLNHNRHRDYASDLGRYVQSDPLGLRAGLNRYTYVSDSPLRYSDPEGLIRWAGDVYTFGAAGAIGGQLYWFDLKSQCVDGKYAFIRIFASAITAGVGVKGAGTASGSAGGVEFEDGLTTIDPGRFSGDFKVCDASIGVILVGGYTIYKAGQNTSYLNLLDPSQTGLNRIKPSPSIGVSASASCGWGSSAVVSVDIKCCGGNR
jgi:RHS repeat-associated protein